MSVHIIIHCEEDIRVTSTGVHGNNIEATVRDDGTLVIAPPRKNMETYRGDSEDNQTSIVAYGPWAGNGRDADYGGEGATECTVPLNGKIGNMEIHGAGMVVFDADVFAPGPHELLVFGECTVSLSDAELDSLACRVHDKSYVCRVRVKRGVLSVHQNASMGDVYIYEEATISANDGGTISAKYPSGVAEKITVRRPF